MLASNRLGVVLGTALIATGTLAVTTVNAAPILYEAQLSGLAESPPNASPGIGEASVSFDLTAHTLSVDVSFNSLLGTTTASHIHCCTMVPGTGTAIVATLTPTFTFFPSGVTSGTYSHTFDTSLASTWNAPFLAAHGGTPSGAEAALAAGLSADEAYLNIHTTVVPGGEIRGFLVEAVPEPASLGIFGVALAGFGLARRKTRGRA